MAKTKTKKNPAKSEGKMLGPFTKAEIKMLRDAIDAYEDIVEEGVHEFGERPESDLDVFNEVNRKVK